MDGWEDSMRRSMYGCLLAEVGEYPFIIGLKELTGALDQRSINLKCIIAVCTDNLTTMQAFHCKWTVEYSWILQLPCIMHGINTIMGKLISKNVKILEELAKEYNVTQGLRKNTETRFYAIILQAISLQEHKQILYKLVLELDHWQCNSEFIQICKPLVNVIGDTESCDATLADCMIQLIWAHYKFEDKEFLQHAKRMIMHYFHTMNTNLHWLTLFLHPLCRRLAISSSVHSYIARKWDWSKAEAYANEEKPFDGGDADAKRGGIESLAAVVPHAPKVEHFFSNLGGVQSVKKLCLTVSHLASLGMLQNNYNHDLYKAAVKEGKVMCCQHGHMHTTSYKGINTECTDILIEGFSIPTPFTTSTENVEIKDLEDYTLQELEAEFAALDQSGFTIESGDGLSLAVNVEEVYNTHLIDTVHAGNLPSLQNTAPGANCSMENDMEWDAGSILCAMGIQ
ncbi:hypothetical protein BDQ17DRAFT_1393275 [Cyathus striatus]|nr:hypothetical protein BDQ17DRAFT_1393275 [Cyathus striatus]